MTWTVVGAFALGVVVGWASLIAIVCVMSSAMREGAADVAAAFTPTVSVPNRSVGAADSAGAGPDLDPLQSLRPGEQRHRGGAARINGRALDRRGLRTDGQGHVIRGRAIW
jgi:hypothetical protein